MDRTFIDVDFTEAATGSDNRSRGVGLSGIINNITESLKEYKMYTQQEQTKRGQINAELKLGLAEINAKKEVVLKQLDDRHKMNMQYIEYIHETVMKELDVGIEAVRAAIDAASETKDFSAVKMLIDTNNEFVQLRNEFTLKLMDKTNEKLLFISENQTALLDEKHEV